MRAAWLAQLSDAIEGAQRLAWQLGTRHHPSLEARELYGRLEAARIELESLRGVTSNRRAGELPDSEWLEALGWNGPIPEPTP